MVTSFKHLKEDAFRYYSRRLRTWVSLALDMQRYLAKSALDSMPLVPIRPFHRVARSIASNLICERVFRRGLVIRDARVRENIIN